MFGALLIHWAAMANHTSILADELTFLKIHLARALYYAAQSAIVYLALEPYFRRLWPRQLVSWVRLLDGRMRDRLVGRDVLLGALMGSVMAAFVLVYFIVRTHVEPSWEWPLDPGRRTGPLGQLLPLSDPAYEIGDHMSRFRSAVSGTFLSAGILLLTRLLLRNQVAAVCTLGAYSFFAGTLLFGSGWLGFAMAAVGIAVYVGLLLRIGILSVMTYMFVFTTLLSAGTKFDPGTWYVGRCYVTLLILVLIGIWSFRVTTAGRPLFHDVLSRP